MASTLLRMFNLAKATGASALENYTTEVLAAALRGDAAPMAHALRVLGREVPSTFDFVETQVFTAGVGILDLVLRAGSQTLVVEVKVGADENDGQLGRYLEWLKTQAAADQGALVLLGPRDLTSEPDVTWLSWQALSDSVAVTRTTHPYWLDLVCFLEELGMVDNFNTPVTADEAASVGNSYRLLRKLQRVLAGPAALMNSAWPGSNWPEKDSDIRLQLMSRFSTGRQLSLEHRARYKAGVSMGVYDWEGEAWLGIWVWCNPRKVAERDSIRALAANVPLSQRWEQDPASWELLGAGKKLVEVPEISAASQWLLDRIGELAAVGMFALIERLGSAPPDEEEPP